MARTCLCALFFAILFADVAISVDPPSVAPSPAPELGAYGPLTPAPSLDDEAKSSSTPSDSPFSSPPSPPSPAPSPDLGESPDSSPATSPATPPEPVSDSVPAPSESDIVYIDTEEDHNGSKGNGGGRKAGIAIGVIAAAGLVGGAGCVLKKRRENERRAQYGYAMRRELL